MLITSQFISPLATDKTYSGGLFVHEAIHISMC
jgi:hypothetical protein